MAVPESEVRSAVEALPVLWRRVMVDPHGFFSDMPETGGLGQPGIFLVACAEINGLGHLLVGCGVRGIAAAPSLAFWVPLLGVVALLYSAYLALRGLERVHGLDPTRALLTLGVGVAVLWLLRNAFTGPPV